MVNYGSSDYNIALSSTQSAGPTGDIIYLCMENTEKDYLNKDRIRHTVAGKSYSSKVGKRVQSFIMKRAIITHTSSELKNIDNRLRSWHRKSASPFYLHVKDGEGTYLQWDNDSESNVNYLKGFFKRYKIQMVRGKIAYLSGTFEECYT